MLCPVPYCSITDVHPMTKWEAGQSSCLRVVLSTGSILLQVGIQIQGVPEKPNPKQAHGYMLCPVPYYLQYDRCSSYDKVGSRTELMSSYCAVNGINTAAGQYKYKVSQKNLTKIGPWVHAMSSALLQYHRCSPYDKVGSRTELMSSCCALNRINSAAGWYTNTRCPRKT